MNLEAFLSIFAFMDSSSPASLVHTREAAVGSPCGSSVCLHMAGHEDTESRGSLLAFLFHLSNESRIGVLAQPPEDPTWGNNSSQMGGALKTHGRSLISLVYPKVTLKLLFFFYHREWWLGTCVWKSEDYFPQFWIKKIRKLWVPWILPLGWLQPHPAISEIQWYDIWYLILVFTFNIIAESVKNVYFYSKHYIFYRGCSLGKSHFI